MQRLSGAVPAMLTRQERGSSAVDSPANFHQFVPFDRIMKSPGFDVNDALPNVDYLLRCSDASGGQVNSDDARAARLALALITGLDRADDLQ